MTVTVNNAYNNCESMIRNHASSNNNDDIAQQYKSFINSFDGSEDAFANANVIMTNIFHPDLQLHADKGTLSLEWYRNWAKTFAENGNSATISNIKSNDDGFEVAIRNVVDGQEMDLIWYQATVILEDERSSGGKKKIISFAATDQPNTRALGQLIDGVENQA